MGAVELEPRPIVVVGLDAQPSFFGMATRALLAESPLVRIARPVTTDAVGRCGAKFGRLHMAALTAHRGVSPLELEIREGVVDGVSIELDDIGVSSLVIRVA